MAKQREHSTIQAPRQTKRRTVILSEAKDLLLTLLFFQASKKQILRFAQDDSTRVYASARTLRTRIEASQDRELASVVAFHYPQRSDTDTMPKTKTIALRCPTCTKLVTATDPDFPFCSDRCRIIDLGKWASGAYRISTPIHDPESLEELPEGTQRATRSDADDES